MSSENDDDFSGDDGTGSTDEDFEQLLQEHLDGDDDGQGTSEDEDGGDDEGNDDDDGSSNDDGDEEGSSEHDDDDDDTVNEKDRRKTDPRQARAIVRLQRSEARVVELERELRDLKTAVKQTERKQVDSSGDILDDLIDNIATKLGVKRGDDRLRTELFELGADLMAELNDDSDNPEIRARLQRRDQSKRERAIQKQIEELKTSTSQRDREAQEREGIERMSSHLTSIKASKTYPYLYSVEDDVPRTVLNGIAALVEEGHRVTDDNVQDTIDFIMKMIDDEHRSRYERVGKALGKNGKNGVSSAKNNMERHTQGQQKARNRTETHGSQKQGQKKDRNERKGGRTVTASGVGQRTSRSEDKVMKMDDLFESMLSQEIRDRGRRGRR